MKFIVSATQLITQDVQFIVEVPDDHVDPERQARMQAENSEDIELYDSRDEVYHRNIVTNVRPATEEESK